MAQLQVLALISVFIVGASSQSDIRIPPNILVPKATPPLYFLLDANEVVNCIADGTPKPTYRWLKNGNAIVPSTYITFNSTTGDLRFTNFSSREEGTFVCIASNVFDNGQGGQITPASWSVRVKIYQSRINHFDNPTPIAKQGSTYDYMFMACGGQNAAVGSTIIYNWYQATRVAIDLDGGRLYIDQLGNLHFAYLLDKDSLISGYYCGISTEREPLIRLGTKYTLAVNSRPSVSIKPQIQYSNSGVKGLLYSSAKLECVFSGYDASAPNLPIIQWVDDANQPIVPSEKYIISPDGRALTITSLLEQDEKQYTCRGRNSAGDAFASVLLNVTSGPIFVDGVPKDKTMPENTDVQFNCDTRSASKENPPGPPTWAINGNKMAGQNDPNKFQLSGDSKILTIRNLKKATDIMCVQCEVSNDIDTVLANACLNVILPITITRQPALIQDIRFGGNLDMTITATTDPSVTLSYRWEFKNKSYEGSNHPPNMVYNPSTNLAYINTSRLSEDQYGELAGTYRRVIYNLYDTKNVDIDVILADRQASTAVGGIDPWIIGLIIALILLIIIIIIIIFIICRKKQEGDYNVDKKETGAGLDPEKELKDKEFNAYSTPTYDEYYNYPDSKPPAGDPEMDETIIGDDESLGEYGKEDITHFNEDGSFIGIYQSKHQPPAQPAESTI